MQPDEKHMVKLLFEIDDATNSSAPDIIGTRRAALKRGDSPSLIGVVIVALYG